MNLNRMAADIGVGGLGIASPSPLGVLGAAWPQPPGTSSHASRPRIGILRYRARKFHRENSALFGFTSDFSKLHSLEPDASVTHPKNDGVATAPSACSLIAQHGCIQSPGQAPGFCSSHASVCGRLAGGPAKMAATNKYLARSNKPRTGSKATKKRHLHEVPS